MKTRNGFISNSSSTSFVLLFKEGGVDEACNLISKYDQYFDLHFDWKDDYHTDYVMRSSSAQDLIGALQETKDHLKLISIDDLIETWKNQEITNRADKDPDHRTYREEELGHIITLRNRLSEWKRRGLNSVLGVGCGGPGSLIRGELGTILSMEGCLIFINKPDFGLFSIQHSCMRPWWKAQG